MRGEWRQKGKTIVSSRKVWSSGCQGIYDILCGPGSQAGGSTGDMLLRAPSRSPTNTFCPDPAPFLGNQQHPLCLLACLLGSKGCKNNLKVSDCSSRAPHSHITFALTMDTRQKTVMQNWHDLLVQFKNFMTFCLTLADSCTDTHFLYPSILVFRLSSTILLNNLFLPSNSWIQDPSCS